MSTQTTMTGQIENRAIVMQCLFAACGQVNPRVGEVEKYVNKWGKNHMTRYQIERVLHELVRERAVNVTAGRYGKRHINTYEITTTGALLLVSLFKFLPSQIRKLNEAVFLKVGNAAMTVLNDYRSQGVL